VELTLLDWIIVGSYLIFALGVGIYYSRQAGESPEEYYLAGRSLPWWVLGTSMVATTFAADTPLAITEMSRKQGIWENWFWWNWLLYGLLAVFLFARLWRRANVLTENFAILYNFIVMGWVMLGMSSVLSVMLFDEPQILWQNESGSVAIHTETLIICGLAILSTVYALLSGFWGVVVTDVVQFVIAMVGAVALATIAVSHVGGMSGLMTKLDTTLAKQAVVFEERIEAKQTELSSASDEDKFKLQSEIDNLTVALDKAPKNAEQATRIVPPFPDDIDSIFSMKFANSQWFQFVVLILVMWWSNHSTDGGGYLAQRTMAAKDEKHALAANLWYNFANYALRTWPWVIVALVSMVLIPDLTEHSLGNKAGYPLVMRKLLGPGMRGLLLVSFLAAFMSTIDTHLNWASSYLVHDIYRRFLNPNDSNKHYVAVGRITTVVLMIVAAVLATQMGSIEKAWKFVMALGGGIGLVLILRWFWWRINAWSEITALAMSVAATLGFEVIAYQQTVAAGEAYKLFGNDPRLYGEPFPFHLQLLVIVFVSLVSWVTVTFLTKPEPDETLEKFYTLVQPGGWWAHIAERVPQTMPTVARGFVGNFIAGLAFVWGGMFFIGYVLFGKWMWAGIMLATMLAGFFWIWKHCLSRLDVIEDANHQQ
jgi:Na+/proline symporter